MKYQFQIRDFHLQVKNHSMEVELDNGVHRSLKFSNDGSSNHYFRLNTFPDHLCYSGDMGSFVFTRNHDMFQFFRRGGQEISVNPWYWHEKLVAHDIPDGSTEFDHGKFVEFLNSCVEDDLITEHKRDEVLNHNEDSGCSDHEWQAYESLYSEAPNLMDDPPSFRSLTYRYMWGIHAIVWGIQQYDKFKDDQTAKQLKDLAS